MKIALDGMGGDKAPQAVVEGAVQAAREFGEEIILVGQEHALNHELSKYKPVPAGISVQHAPTVVEMHEGATVSIRRKRDSSISIGIELAKKGKADAFISAGNTGAVVASAVFNLGLLPDVERPGIAIVFPTLFGFSLLIDVGANIDPSSKHLLQYAIMGDAYSKYILKKANPSIGLLNVGAEESKGTEFFKETHKLLQESGLHFIGNVEGRDIFTGKTDVIVCDGFAGNVVLKVSESLASAITTLLRNELGKSKISQLGAFLSRSAFKALAKETDYSEYGGAPLLGLNGRCFISHGTSSAKAIRNAIRVAIEFMSHHINDHIIEGIKRYSAGGKK
jgi:glycerol-3-phosphate acyltransferase PlsX